MRSRSQRKPFVASLRYTYFGLLWIYLKAAIRFGKGVAFAVYAFFAKVIGGTISRIISLSIPLAILLVALAIGFALNVFYQPVIDFVVDKALPYIQILYDIFILAINLLLDLYDIVYQIWNVCVPLIGFIAYFVIDLAITIFREIYSLLGMLDLPSIFQDLMEVITMLVQIAVNLLRAVITASVSILQFLARIIGILVRVFFFIMRGLVPVVKFIFWVLPVVLRPILWILVQVSAWFSAIFASMRSLLSVDGIPTAESVTSAFVAELGAKTAELYKQEMYEKSFEQTGPIADYFNRIFSYPVPNQGVAGGLHGDIPEDEQLDRECILQWATALDPNATAIQCSREKHGLHHYLYKNDWHTLHSDPSGEENGKDEEIGIYRGRARDGTTTAPNTERKLNAVNLDDEKELEQIKNGDAYVFVMSDNEIYTTDPEQQQQQTKASPPKPKKKAHRRIKDHEEPQDMHEYYEWEAIHLRGKKPEDIFPGLRHSGGLREHKPLIALVPKKTAKQLFDRQVRVHAALHAFEHAAHHVHHHHIKHGHFEWAWKTAMKHARFKSAEEALHHYTNNYHSAFHFVHDTIGPPSEWPILKTFKEMDPTAKHRRYHADYYKQVHGIDNIYGEEMKKAFMVHAFALNSSRENGESEFLGEGVYDRQLNAIRLQVLYERDCFTTDPRNFLCLPPGPKGRLKSSNLTAVFLPFQLDRNAACGDLYYPTTCSLSNLLPCFFSWNRVLNALVIARFGIFYGLALVWRVLFFLKLLFPNDPAQMWYAFGQQVTWLRWFVNWTLLIGKGQNPTMLEVIQEGRLPSFRQYLCWFLNVYDFLLIVLYIAIISIFGPTIEDFWNSVILKLSNWYVRYLQDRELRYQELQGYLEEKFANIEQSLRNVNVASPMFRARFGQYSQHPGGGSGVFIGDQIMDQQRSHRHHKTVASKYRHFRKLVSTDDVNLHHLNEDQQEEWRRHNLRELRELIHNYRTENTIYLRNLADLFGFSLDFETTTTARSTAVSNSNDNPSWIRRKFLRLREVLQKARRSVPITQAHRPRKHQKETTNWKVLVDQARAEALGYERSMRHFFIDHTETETFLRVYQQQLEIDEKNGHIGSRVPRNHHSTFVHNVHPEELHRLVDHEELEAEERRQQDDEQSKGTYSPLLPTLANQNVGPQATVDLENGSL